MADEPMSICPACGRRSLVDHCRARACAWHRCLQPDCQLVANLRRGIGHKISTGGVRVRWKVVR